MTAADPRFLAEVLDDLAPLGPIQLRPYFGGVALAHDGGQFAFVMGTTLYVAATGDTRPTMRSHGGRPFQYPTRTGTRTVEAFYDTPTEIVADPDRLLEWTRAAIAARRMGPHRSRRLGGLNATVNCLGR